MLRRGPRAVTGLLVGVLAAGCTASGATTHDAFTDPRTGAPTTASVQPSTASPTPSRTAKPKPKPKPKKKPLVLLRGAPRLAIVANFTEPTYVVAPPGDSRLFVLEKRGTIRILNRGKLFATPFLDIRTITSTKGESGLLSMAFAPDYRQSGLVYIDHDGSDGNLHIDEYRVSKRNPNVLDPRSRRGVLFIKKRSPNHNGGLLLFDRQHRLLISVGDGGEPEDPAHRGQNLSTPLGKILRIDPRKNGRRSYRIPPGNPFVHYRGARPEILAYGLRNPWRFALDPLTQDLYVGDVGQYTMEELDIVPARAVAGANFGWSINEGTLPFHPGQPHGPIRPAAPSVTYRHRNGRCAITAGRVYRGRIARLRGLFVYGDFCSAEIFVIRPTTRRGLGPTPSGLRAPNTLSSFGEDGFGELYVCTLAGTVFKVTADA